MQKLKPGLVAFYDIRPGKGVFLFWCFINLSLTYLLIDTYPLTYSPGTHIGHWKHIHDTIILQPLYRSTCISQQPQLRTWGFCWSKVLLPICLCWQQLLHSD